MAEPFKTIFNPRMIAAMGRNFARAQAGFPRDAFVADACDGLEGLEMKDRARRIAQALDTALPEDFNAACATMLGALAPQADGDWSADDDLADGIAGWGIMPMGEVVAKRGLDHFDAAMEVLRAFTMRFTAEFAVRPFFAADPERALGHAMSWTQDRNHHVRRLASEGSRPRLPWGMRLQGFCDDPAPLLPLLTALRDDGSDYVRRSVANSLNDIGKDHPDLVAEIAADWLAGASAERKKLVRHACRSLVKAGHGGTLTALGYGPVKVEVGAIEILTPLVRLGEALEFAVAVTGRGTAPQPAIIDYVIHHRKANGATSDKVFKWKVMELAPGRTQRLSRRHPMRPITTRVYHAGTHFVELSINGTRFGRTAFELEL